MAERNFLRLTDLSPTELKKVVARASELKQLRKAGRRPRLFESKVLTMVFDKSSTRTRVSFETAMSESGGSSVFLSPRDSQLGRGEPVSDSARVLSEMCDAIMVRTFAQETIEVFAEHASVPVINGLTDSYHPCQLLADLQTFLEHRGDISGRTVAWVGDGNNMCNTYIEAASLLEFNLRIAVPEGFEPALLEDYSDKASIELVRDPVTAVRDAALVVTDVWASMGQEDEARMRRQTFSRFQVNAELMAHASDDALFMHCLPAHRGEEVTAEVIDTADTVVWDEAGNRLHSQKALLEFLLSGGDA
jgi:ornithine carbamoyltransferase